MSYLVFVIQKEYTGLLIDDDFPLLKFFQMADQVHIKRYVEEQKKATKQSNQKTMR